MRLRLNLSTATALLLLLAAPASAADEKTTPGKVSGQLEEACSCDAACPCWFDSKPTKMNCSVGFALFIDNGAYEKVPAMTQMEKSAPPPAEKKSK